MEKHCYAYEQPEIEIIEISVEKGFGGSPDDGGGNADGGSGGGESGDVDW